MYPTLKICEIKQMITSAKRILADIILLQSDIIHVHLRKEKTLAELEREICHKREALTNIYDVYNSNKNSTGEIEVIHNKYYGL